jgi:hypothetical protein
VSVVHEPSEGLTAGVSPGKSAQDAFLRRCTFYCIEFPDVPLMLITGSMHLRDGRRDVRHVDRASLVP